MPPPPRPCKEQLCSQRGGGGGDEELELDHESVPPPKSRVPSLHHTAPHLPIPVSCWPWGSPLYLGPNSARLRGATYEKPREAWLVVGPRDPWDCQVTAKCGGRSVQCPLPALPAPPRPQFSPGHFHAPPCPPLQDRLCGRQQVIRSQW